MINTKDLSFQWKEVSDCVDESMKLINELENWVQSQEVLDAIEEEKEAIELMLCWVDKH